MSKRAKDAGSDEMKPPTSDHAESNPNAAASPEPPTLEEQVEALKAQIAQKDNEIADLKDKYLRALAENENARKRLRQQNEDVLRFQRESLLHDLLPILDHLELAVAAAQTGGDGKPIVEGIEMVLRSMHDLMRRHGVTPQQSVGQPFNPRFHEAVDHVESLDYQPNTVISEFNRGYQIGDRVLRPARVSVAKAPAVHKKSGASDGNQAEKNNGDVEKG